VQYSGCFHALAVYLCLTLVCPGVAFNSYCRVHCCFLKWRKIAFFLFPLDLNGHSFSCMFIGPVLSILLQPYFIICMSLYQPSLAWFFTIISCYGIRPDGLLFLSLFNISNDQYGMRGFMFRFRIFEAVVLLKCNWVKSVSAISESLQWFCRPKSSFFCLLAMLLLKLIWLISRFSRKNH
jgi:hypothetical protein